MNPANDVARNSGPAIRALILSAALASSGCATGGNVWHASAGAMSSMLWSRARAEPGYDFYAQNMANSKAAKQVESAGTTAQGQPAAGEKPVDDRSGAAPAAAASPGEAPRPATDAKVHVTLGRPESMPVLRNADGDPGPLLASADPAPAPRASEPTEPARRFAPRVADPVPEPEPEPAPAVAAAAPAVDEPAPASAAPGITLKTLLEGSRKKLEAMSTYQVAITRTERVGSQVLPEEKALLSIRRNPKAVRLEWPEGSNKGREVIYSAAINDRVMHVNVANSAIPIPRMSIPVDSPLALRNSRHSITEAGFDTIFNNLSGHIDDQGRSKAVEGRLTYKGLQRPEGLDFDCHLIQRITPAKEVWRVYLDPESLMPAVVTAHQADGGLLESYKYEGLRADPAELASADAFDPDKRWGESKGLFSRIARAAGAVAEQPAPTTTR